MEHFKNISRSLEVEVNHALQEQASHGTPTLPMAIYIDEFSKYSVPVIQHHWHKEIQLAYVLEGSVEYELYGEKILLHKGDGLFINSNILHMSTSFVPENTQMVTILFDQTVLSGINQIEIEKKYVLPVTNCKELPYYVLTDDIPWKKEILKNIKKIIYAEDEKNFGYELEQKNTLGEIWLILLRNLKHIFEHNTASVISADESRIKIMLKFIHENYKKNISLDDIASSASLSKSECCRCFKRSLNVSPFEYLIQNRVLVSAKLLVSTDKSISSISEEVGFNGLSYFYKTFKSIMKMTPAQFREKEKMS